MPPVHRCPVATIHDLACGAAGWKSLSCCVVSRLCARHLTALLHLLAAFTASAAWADASADAAAEANAKAGARERPPLFMWGDHRLGLNIGYGHGVASFHSGVQEGHQARELIVLPHYQIDLTRPPVSRSWYRGRLSLRAEATLIVNFRPHSGVAGGLGLLLRYRFLALERWQPYVEGGAGFLGLDLDLADQADGFAFQPQGGVGLLYTLSPRTHLELGTRFHHVSNAFTREPNGGIDTFQVLIGVTHAFE